MNLPFHIAWRYLKSKKSHNVINIISGISVAGVTIGTMALIVVLSVFNGFEELVVSLFNSFDPPLKVTPATGKTFNSTAFPWDEIKKTEGVYAATGVIEEKALLKYGSNQFLATVKGVDENYETWTGLDSMMIDGSLMLTFKDQPLAIPGQGIAYYLGINLNSFDDLIEVYAANRTASNLSNPENAFNRLDIRPAGVFSVQQDFDTKYMIVPLSFARELFEYPDELTSVEIALKEGSDVYTAQEKIKALLGNKYVVKNRFEQQDTLYKVMKTEKFAIFLILSFILFIAAFNMIGSLSMLILDKRKDINILYSLGANHRLIQKIFISEGTLVMLTGAVVGMFLGALICILQQQFGLVKINAEGGSFLIDAYPVKMYFMDFLNVFLMVGAIGLIATIIPVAGIRKFKGNIERDI
ncbi:MAG TPA: ABC transporter permease [Lentimicrobium sp.]|nr:ABC transporter permease [Lentimicrobium sp.]